MPDYKVYPFDAALHNGSWHSYEYEGIYQILFKDTFGHIGSLADHNISSDGTVSPSVVCAEENCSYHEHIKLESWIPVTRG